MQRPVTTLLACLVLTVFIAEDAGAKRKKGRNFGLPPVAVARAYFAAMDSSDLDAAEALFASESSVFERGSVEGDWAHYRAHHLGPEIDQVVSFKTTLKEPEEGQSGDATMAFVTWPIEYRIELKDKRVIESRGTVTFVFVREGVRYRIRHLHWSSRRK